MFSKSKKEKFYLTTAIDYVNSAPHIGTAYEKVAADTLARFKRMQGFDVRFQMGNDEHSINVKKAAIKEGLDPKVYCDLMKDSFLSAWKSLDISYDGFIRTTDPEHHKSVKKLFQAILDSGDIEKSTYKGWYCDSCEAFLTDKDLVDGQCPNHKTKPDWLEEDNFFFKLSKYQDKLLKHIKANPEFILPASRRNEVVSMIEMGLNDISVSRSSREWGITLPNDETHVVYVWFDALINYLTAIGYASDEKSFKKMWPADIHFIGKDIIRFHCVIWPAMLMSAGLPLPKSIFAHGFVYLKGEKMSKSMGNVVRPMDITKEYGPDPLRYFLLRETTCGRDTDFTWEAFITRYNSDLANGIGNLVSRTVGMISRYLDGKVLKVASSNDKLGSELKENVLSIPAKISESMAPNDNGLHFNNALSAIWEGITAADIYINENKPWELKKVGDTKRINLVISNVTEAIRALTVLLKPFMPSTAEKIWNQFNFGSLAELDSQNLKTASKWGFIRKTLSINAPVALFPRIEEKKEEPLQTTPKNEIKKEKKMGDNLIDISDFAAIDLRVAEILEAEKVEGADKLLKLQVSLGEEKRQIVAGIALAYKPESLIGKKIAVVANLKPVKLRGVESHGMLLAASTEETVSILTPLKDVPAGTKIK